MKDLIKRILLLHRYGEILQANHRLHQRFAGQRCFVVGNGPSLKKMDLSLLSKEQTYTVNDFYLHQELDLIRPTFFSSIEPIKRLEDKPVGSRYRPERYYADIAGAYASIKPIFFFEVSARDFHQEHQLFEGQEVYYLASGKRLLDRGALIDDISRPNSFLDASIYSAICNCVYMGFREIYLIGCDFDHILNQGVVHFYKKDEKVYLDESTNMDRAYNLYLYLKKMDRLNRHFRAKGVQIFNAGVGGLTDTFPRVRFEDLFEGVQQGPK